MKNPDFRLQVIYLLLRSGIFFQKGLRASEFGTQILQSGILRSHLAFYVGQLRLCAFFSGDEFFPLQESLDRIYLSGLISRSKPVTFPDAETDDPPAVLGRYCHFGRIDLPAGIELRLFHSASGCGQQSRCGQQHIDSGPFHFICFLNNVSPTVSFDYIIPGSRFKQLLIFNTLSYRQAYRIRDSSSSHIQPSATVSCG